MSFFVTYCFVLGLTIIMKLFSWFYPLYRTNSCYITLIVVGGIGFDYAFNKYTNKYFDHFINNDRTFVYLEPKIRMMNSLKESEEEYDYDDGINEEDDDE